MNTPTNTNGIIAAAAEKKAVEKAPAKKQSPANQMRVILDSASTQKLLRDSLKENAGAFTASVLELYKSDSKLQMCDAGAVFAECLKAVALKLPISKQLGFAYVVPYKRSVQNEEKKWIEVTEPQFQIGYKGMIQLCMRTGAYKYINADVVYKGEYQGTDKLTGYVDLNGKKISDDVIGYFAYIETISGFKKTVYWDRDKMEKHALQYSKAYKAFNAKKIKNTPWADNFDDMAIKTVLRNLLSKYGVMSVEMANALQSEDTPADIAFDAPLQGDSSEIDVDISSAEQAAEIPAEGGEALPKADENDGPDPTYPFD